MAEDLAEHLLGEHLRLHHEDIRQHFEAVWSAMRSRQDDIASLKAKVRQLETMAGGSPPEPRLEPHGMEPAGEAVVPAYTPPTITFGGQVTASEKLKLMNTIEHLTGTIGKLQYALDQVRNEKREAEQAVRDYRVENAEWIAEREAARRQLAEQANLMARKGRASK